MGEVCLHFGELVKKAEGRGVAERGLDKASPQPGILVDILNPIEEWKREVHFPSLSRVRKIFWGLGLASWFIMMLMIFVVQSNPDHLTPQYPDSMRINGIVSYMTVTQERALKILFVVFFGCALATVSVELCTRWGKGEERK